MASLQSVLAFQPFSAEEPNEQYGSSKNCHCTPITIAVVLHLIIFFFIWQSTSTLWLTPKVKGEKVAMLYFPPGPKLDIAKPAKPRPRPRQHVVSKPAIHTAPAKAAPHFTPPPSELPTITPPPPPPPEEDMMAHVEAARKRRAAQAAENAPPAAEEAEDENARALRIAKANFASTQKHGNDKEDAGGVFQIKNQTSHSAEFTFRGWNATMRRMWPQQYVVELGQERDIEMAIINKMIEVIRKHKDGDFVWESHRLGRNITLSARVADTEQLQKFLLKEFFPQYRPSAN